MSDPQVRWPAVAGQFYPESPAALRAMVERCLGGHGEPRGEEGPRPALAVVAPHAGYVYSGEVAGAVYATTALPGSLVILCPNHTGEGDPVAVIHRGCWRTPLGDAAIDETLADRILRICPMATVDERAHRREHAIEVQIPFLQIRMQRFSFVPICVGVGNLDALLRLGRALGGLLRESPGAGLVISSDMSHYVTAAVASEKDMLAVERIEKLDAEGLHRVVRDHDISMCGFAPAVAGLAAAREAGAGAGRLVAYANSGDASGDYDRVVGYAGLAIA